MLGWGYVVTASPTARAALLRAARGDGGVPALLDRLEPSYPHYVRNRRELAHYRGLAQAGEPAPLPALPKGAKVEPGRSWAGVAALRARLKVLGDLAAEAPPAQAPPDELLYDAATVAAVKRFQARHILDPDGVVGAGTIEALNVPLARRVRQLELAMERGRWLPRLTDRPTVFVNVPLFRLWASDPVRGEEPLRMNVVVGKAVSNRTPIFLEEMEYVVFRPYWNPPRGITTKEIIPHARRDPSYLERENLEIVASGDDDAPALPATGANLDAVAAGRLRVRQRPGPTNSLGLASSSSRTTRTSTCTGLPRSSSSHGRGGTSATAASAWKTPRASPRGSCGTTPPGLPHGSRPPCRGSGPRTWASASTSGS